MGNVILKQESEIARTNYETATLPTELRQHVDEIIADFWGV
jgi:hypothetical protein